MGVVLGIYLYRIGLSSLFIGFVIAAGLTGSALATILMSLAADRIGRKHLLVGLSLIGAVGGIALATAPGLPVLAILAFVGMLNGTGTDRSAAYALDQAVIPGLATDARRTWNLALYNLFLDGGGSLGRWLLDSLFFYSLAKRSLYSVLTESCSLATQDCA